mgnify:CR=1 FL=1
MSWKCYSCGTKNANENAVCSKCGNTVAAPAAFYFKWIPGAALFFAFFYTIGVMAGGVLVEAAAAPDEQGILKAANEKREADKKPCENLLQLQPEEVAAARAAATSSGWSCNRFSQGFLSASRFSLAAFRMPCSSGAAAASTSTPPAMTPMV